ncbi:MAG TPA: hypothetical protein VIJ94_11110 [Caulobacteraceae bacterium]
MKHIRLCAASVAALTLLAPLSAGAQSAASGRRVSNAALAQRPTPRAYGHPSLEGYWFSGTGSIPPFQYDTARDAKGNIEVKTVRDPSEAPRASGANASSQPDYKDELKQKTKDLFFHDNKTDKVYNCGQPGLPRVGAPQRIVENSRELVFLYADLAGMVWRLIPIGGKMPTGADASYYGDSEAHWVGDSLVVHTTNFNQDTWLGEFGYIHSDKMEVTERFARVGDTIRYDVTVSDPGVLKTPWVKPTVIMRLEKNNEIIEPSVCHIDPLLEGDADGQDGQFHIQRF